MKESTVDSRCTAEVWSKHAWRSYRCPYKAKEGGLCGVHQPRPKKETKYDRFNKNKEQLEAILATMVDKELAEKILRLAWAMVLER